MSQESSTTGTSTINGALITYEMAGAGRTVVFLHAGICDRRMWDPQFDRYAERFRVIRYDMRGFGDSPMVAGPFSHAGDLVALLDRLDVDRAIFIGASMGGAVALDLALAHPGRVDAVVTVGSSPRGFDIPDPALAELWKEAESAFARGDLDRVNEIEMQAWLDGPHRPLGGVDPTVRAKAEMMNLRMLQLESDVEGDAQRPSIVANDHLHELTIPVLAVVGNLDRIGAVEGSRRIAASVAGGRFVEIPGTAHLPSMEQPRAFDDLVLPFLTSLDQRRMGNRHSERRSCLL